MRKRAGELIGVLLAGLAMLACSRPNPAYNHRVDAGAGGAGGAGGNGGLDLGSGGTGTPAPDADGGTPPGDGSAIPEPDVAPTADADPVSTLDTNSAPEAAPPADMALPIDMALPPDLAVVNLDAGLRARWSFNETSGTRVNDPIGNNTGTLQLGADRVASGIPNATAANLAARFRGTDDHMTIAIQSLPTLQAQKTIALWIRPAVLSHSAMRTILALATSNDSSGIQIGTEGGRPAAWRWGTASGGAQMRYTGSWTDRWYHLTYTFDGQKHAFYVDGSPVAVVSSFSTTGTIGNAVLGCYDKDELGWEMYEGLLDDLRIYDRVLNQAEIERLLQGE